MRIVCIVRMKNKYLFKKNSKTEKYELPFVQCVNYEEGIEKLKLEVKELGIGIFTFINANQEFSNCDDIEVYYPGDFSYITNKGSNWLDFDGIDFAEFEDWCLHICVELAEKRKKELEIYNVVKNTINTIIDDLGLQVELVETGKDISIFIKSNGYDYCPYIFTVGYEEEDNETVALKIVWRVSKMYASGEKTDLYVLFANSMNIILKVCFNELAEVVYIDHIACPDEIDGAAIIFNNRLRSIAIQDLSDIVKDLFGKFLVAMQIHSFLFGSYGLQLKRDTYVEREWLLDNVKVNNTISREDNIYFVNFEHGISMLELSAQQYKPQMITRVHEWKMVDGIDGKIIVQYENAGKSYNLIPKQRWEYIQKILEKDRCNHYTIVCQENILYLLESNRIWILEGGYYHYWVEEEKEKILERQKRENEFLFFDKKFKWKYPIVPSRFEELIADLLENEPRVCRVRLMGKTNNQDGGRDILVYKMAFSSEPEKNKEYLVIGQCKAYEHSVNKSHVTDIRDMLENYDAKGFILAVASELTVPLIDNLNKLSENFEVEWWTEREIFSKLRRNFYLLERYKDIVEIIQ